MIPLCIIFLSVLFMLGTAFIKGSISVKRKELIASISLFALVWGVLGQVIGLIGGLKMLEKVSSISPSVLAGGLSISLYSVAFGLIIYLIARLGIILFIWTSKE